MKTLESIIASVVSVVKPSEKLTVSQWASKYRYINMPGAHVGLWNADKTPYMTEPLDVLSSLDHTAMVFVGPARTGKALALDTPIPTPDGWTTMGDLREGDYVFGSNGAPVRVTLKSEVFHDHDCYKVTFSDGTFIVADADHKWTVIDSANQNKKRVLTTEYMSQRVRYRKVGRRNRFFIEAHAPLQFTGRDLPLHPYILGLWL